MLTLLFTGGPPVRRVAAAAPAGLLSVALLAWLLLEGQDSQVP
jgi:hypothetical protein